eukprot:11734117-Heterocapsa_arctica.AAC.1
MSPRAAATSASIAPPPKRRYPLPCRPPFPRRVMTVFGKPLLEDVGPCRFPKPGHKGEQPE